MKFLLVVMTALLMTYPLNVAAHGTTEKQVKAWVVATMVSQDNESKNEFIQRVSAYINRWTMENDSEICGFLATDGARWGVRLTTQKAQVLCFFAKGVVPENMTAIEETIHSHPVPKSGSYMWITDQTMDALRNAQDRGMIKRIKENKGRLHVEIQDFSADDYLTGPGYLVVSGRILYQNGKGTSQQISELATSPPKLR